MPLPAGSAALRRGSTRRAKPSREHWPGRSPPPGPLSLVQLFADGGGAGGSPLDANRITGRERSCCVRLPACFMHHD